MLVILVVLQHTSFTGWNRNFIAILQSAFPSLFSPPMILYQSPSADTHYIVSARDFENRVNYFLTSGQSYQLQVSFCEFEGNSDTVINHYIILNQCTHT